MAPGFPGMIADAAIVQDIETFYNPAEAAFFGRVVSRGADFNLIVHPAAAASITDEKLVRGIVVATHEHVSKTFSDGLGGSYGINHPIPVMRKGRIWVLAEDVVTEGTSTVNVRYAGAAVASETAVLPKSKWKTSTTAANALAVLEIDL